MLHNVSSDAKSSGASRAHVLVAQENFGASVKKEAGLRVFQRSSGLLGKYYCYIDIDAALRG